MWDSRGNGKTIRIQIKLYAYKILDVGSGQVSGRGDVYPNPIIIRSGFFNSPRTFPLCVSMYICMYMCMHMYLTTTTMSLMVASLTMLTILPRQSLSPGLKRVIVAYCTIDPINFPPFCLSFLIP